MKYELTKEQSQELIELGISEELASIGYVDKDQQGWPLFDVADLLGIIPKVIKVDYTTYHLNIDYPPIEQVAVRHIDEEENDLHGVMCDTLADALFHQIKWCIKNNHIKTK